MMQLSLSHDIDCNEAEFWTLFLDRNFTEAHYLQGLGFREFKVLEERETPLAVERTVVAMPNVQLPSPIARLFGPGFRYTEKGAFDKASAAYEFHTVPSALADKILNQGSIRVQALGSHRVRRTVQVVVEARVFALGKLMESLAERTLQDGWRDSARFTNRWIAERRRSS